MGTFVSKFATREALFRKITELGDELQYRKDLYEDILSQLKTADKEIDELKKENRRLCEEHEAVVQQLTNKIAHLSACLDRDGTNAGIPTSATPINKKKIIPNGRQRSDKKKGGQPGHKKYGMKLPNENEIDELTTFQHMIDPNVKHCPNCAAGLIYTRKDIIKNEYDVKVTVRKTENRFGIFRCPCCGKEIHLPIPNNLKESDQYGPNVQALALSLMATGNVPINKVGMLIRGFTNGSLVLSEGYICKLYARAAAILVTFMAALRSLLIQRSLIYWDETVIWIMTERACMRFYGDETIAYYTANLHKDMKSLLGDNILPVLTSDQCVMHDHNRVNYNDRFCFDNIECNQHLQRDLQRITDDNHDHTWAPELKELLTDTMRKRTLLMDEGVSSFSAEALEEFNRSLTELLKKGHRENRKAVNAAQKKHHKVSEETQFEQNVLKRIGEYRENYFRWTDDFRLPTTDNLSERGLRCIKSHLKQSGQFDSEKTARYYAIVKTYTETCRRNGINEMLALSRLCAGNPFTVEEIFGTQNLAEAQ